jgi:hypothetical protein
LKENYIHFWISLTLAGYPAGYPVIRQGNLVSGRIPDIKIGRIIRPDIRASLFGIPKLRPGYITGESKCRQAAEYNKKAGGDQVQLFLPDN